MDYIVYAIGINPTFCQKPIIFTHICKIFLVQNKFYKVYNIILKMFSFLNKGNYWKIGLMLLGAAILAVTVLYSNFLAENLKRNEEKNIYLFKEALKEISKPEVNNNDITLLDTLVKAFPLPVIFEDENGMLEGQNFMGDENLNLEFLEAKKQEFLKVGGVPIEGSGYATHIYCFNSPMLMYIQLFPFVQVLLVGLYIALGYFLFNASRKSEQNRVWAGMAKETAHQLGTPISAILGWIEILKERLAGQEEGEEIVRELTKDIERLELVADRFSKIGSKPVLEKSDIYTELIEVKEYLQRRSPRKVNFNFETSDRPLLVPINKHLFAWVIENLIRNSLDALDGKGSITCKVFAHENHVIIELSDTGHGMAASKFKSIFKPGYSTKKRGWGLGLSLAKRIIEEYHRGKIYVKSSTPNVMTTFAIKLPI